MKNASVPKMFRGFKLLSAVALAGVLMLPLWERYATSLLMADDGAKKQDMSVLQLNETGIPPIISVRFVA